MELINIKLVDTHRRIPGEDGEARVRRIMSEQYRYRRYRKLRRLAGGDGLDHQFIDAANAVHHMSERATAYSYADFKRAASRLAYVAGKLDALERANKMALDLIEDGLARWIDG
jgi:hypothetical protein